VKPDMHKQTQNTVCFNYGRRAEDQVEETVTLRDIILIVLLFVDVYALDEAARQLAVHIIVPMLGR